MDIVRPSRWRPRIIAYDIERDVAREDILKAIARQNPELEIGLHEAENLIKPLFLRGPRERDTVCCVMEISPSLYKKMINFKRVYIGFMSCKIKEFLAPTKCNRCQ